MLAYCKIQQMLYIVAAQLFINQTSTVFEIGTSVHGLYMHAQLICQFFNWFQPFFYGLVWLYEWFRIKDVLNEL